MIYLLSSGRKTSSNSPSPIQSIMINKKKNKKKLGHVVFVFDDSFFFFLKIKPQCLWPDVCCSYNPKKCRNVKYIVTVYSSFWIKKKVDLDGCNIDRSV